MALPKAKALARCRRLRPCRWPAQSSLRRWTRQRTPAPPIATGNASRCKRYRQNQTLQLTEEQLAEQKAAARERARASRQRKKLRTQEAAAAPPPVAHSR